MRRQLIPIVNSYKELHYLLFSRHLLKNRTLNTYFLKTYHWTIKIFDFIKNSRFSIQYNKQLYPIIEI